MRPSLFHVAMPREAACFRQAFNEHSTKESTSLYDSYESSMFTLIVSGIGKVNTAAALAAAVSRFRPRRVINIGFCAGIVDSVRRGSVLVGDAVIVYDYGHFENGKWLLVPMGQPTLDYAIAHGNDERILSRVSGINFDLAMRDKIKSILINNISTGTVPSQLSVNTGCLASGDTFVCDAKEARRIQQMTGAVAIDMESGAVAHVCRKLGVSCSTVKVVSDSASNVTPDDYCDHSGDIGELLRLVAGALIGELGR